MLVRYYGHVGQHSGYGHAANETCMAILAAGIDLEIQTDGKELHKKYLPLAPCIKAEGDLYPNPDAIIVHTMPLDCARVLERGAIASIPAKLAMQDLRPTRLVAYTTWEGYGPISHEVIKALLPFDEVWVPSSQTRRSFADPAGDCYVRGGSSIRVVPHAYDEHEAIQHWMYDPEQPYTFYYVGAWSLRKNVEGVIRAFARTFVPSERVRLSIQSAGAHEHSARLALMATGLPPESWPEITFNPHRMHDIHAAHRRGQCFVTASRGEAWNLPAFDAMLHGNHVIAPLDQGSDDFLAHTSARLYGYINTPAGGEIRLAPGPDGLTRAQYVGCQGLTVRSDWMEPDIVQLGHCMREAFDERAMLRSRPSHDPAGRFGRKAVGDLIRNLLTGATT